MSPYFRLAAVALALGVMLALFELTGLRSQFTLEFIQHELLMHQIGGIVVFTLLFSLGNLIQIPGWLFLAAAVLTLGKISGGTATYIAATISCCITFFTIRMLGQDALRTLDHRIAFRIMKRLHSSPIRNVIFLRVMFQTMPALNYGLAMSGISFRHYLIGTLLGLPLPIALYCLLFDYLGQMLLSRL